MHVCAVLHVYNSTGLRSPFFEVWARDLKNIVKKLS